MHMTLILAPVARACSCGCSGLAHLGEGREVYKGDGAAARQSAWLLRGCAG